MTQSLVGNLLVASTLVTESVFARGVCLMMHHDEDNAIAVMLNRPIWPPPKDLLQVLLSGAADPAAEPSQDGPHAQGAPATKGRREARWQLPTAEPLAGSPSVNPPSAAPQSAGLGPSNAGPGQVVPVNPGMAALPLTPVHFGGPLSGPVLALHGSTHHAEAQTGVGIYVAAQKEHLEQLLREHRDEVRLIVGHAGWSSAQLAAEIEAGFWHVLPASKELIFHTQSDLWPLLIRRATGATVARWIGAPDNPYATALN